MLKKECMVVRGDEKGLAVVQDDSWFMPTLRVKADVKKKTPYVYNRDNYRIQTVSKI